MKPRDKTIELNGRSYRYRETGNASASAIVALHALGEDSTSWDEVAVLLGENYRVLALDQRGHGESARASEYSFELMCEDLLLYADAMELQRFTLMGHSMGGTVSYLFGEAHPSRIKRLIVEDTPPPFVDKRIEIPPKPSQTLPFDWLVITSILQQLNQPNPEWWTRLPDILAPTLVIGGGSTSHIPQHKLQEAANLIPSCELVTVEGAGHYVHRVNLPAFIDAVKQFLHV